MPSEIRLQSQINQVRLTLAEDVIIEHGKHYDANYVHTDNVQQADDVWTVNHNLNKYCSVTVVDDDDNVVIADVVYIDSNSLEIHFAAAVTGKAYLN